MSNTQDLEHQLDELTDVAGGLSDQLEKAHVTVQAIADDLEVDPSSDEAPDVAAASHKRLRAVAHRLATLGEEMKHRLDDT
jgi:hypothetical protein